MKPLPVISNTVPPKRASITALLYRAEEVAVGVGDQASLRVFAIGTVKAEQRRQIRGARVARRNGDSSALARVKPVRIWFPPVK